MHMCTARACTCTACTRTHAASHVPRRCAQVQAHTWHITTCIQELRLHPSACMHAAALAAPVICINHHLPMPAMIHAPLMISHRSVVRGADACRLTCHPSPSKTGGAGVCGVGGGWFPSCALGVSANAHSVGRKLNSGGSCSCIICSRGVAEGLRWSLLGHAVQHAAQHAAHAGAEASAKLSAAARTMLELLVPSAAAAHLLVQGSCWLLLHCSSAGSLPWAGESAAAGATDSRCSWLRGLAATAPPSLSSTIWG